jgi:hypothetical protein
MESPNEAQRESDRVSGQLSFIGKFIDKYFLRQPSWVQSFTFVIFVLLFAYGFILLPGKAVLEGNLWVRKAASRVCPDPCVRPAEYYSLRWGTTDVLSNSKGQYRIVVSPLQYIRLFSSGSHRVNILKIELISGEQEATLNGAEEEFTETLVAKDQELRLNRLENEFENAYVPPFGIQATSNVVPEPPNDNSLISRAWADTLRGRYRLFIQGIRMAGGPTKADISFSLFTGGQTIELKQGRGGQELPVGPIPVVSDQSVDLGSVYYFPIPDQGSPPITGIVRMAWPGGILGLFSGTEEDFSLPSQQTIDQSFQISGSKGSILTVQLFDTSCTAQSAIRERSYFQIPDNRFENEVFIHVGDMYHNFVGQKKSSLYVVVGPHALKTPDNSSHSAKLGPDEFKKLELQTPYRLDFFTEGEHIDFDYGRGKYRLRVLKINNPVGSKQNVIVDVCPLSG